MTTWHFLNGTLVRVNGDHTGTPVARIWPTYFKDSAGWGIRYRSDVDDSEHGTTLEACKHIIAALHAQGTTTTHQPLDFYTVQQPAA